MAAALHTSTLTSLPLLARGKVRDNYAVGKDRLLMVASDRLSAFDVILGEPIPGKGALLTQMALFWFGKLGHICPNHLTGDAPESAVTFAKLPQVVGRSMEPLIPDGSLCLFRPHGGGSRNGQKLLIEKFGSSDATAQFTVKVYRSEKRVHEDGSWEHERIRMIPLNPEFEEWNLTPDEFKVIGEFVAVLPNEE